jgi:glycosyltransferase involved in cell wall biosynthesis
MEDLISVIVPVYNSEQALERTLACIARQTYRNLDIILVDDGSTDSSGRICDAFAEKDARCKVIHQPNGGQGSAKNAGQKAASGDYLFFPDSDDLFHPEIIRILHEAITKDPVYDLAIVGMKKVDDWDVDLSAPIDAFDKVRLVEYSQEEMIRELFDRIDNPFVFGWNKLYRKELLKDLWCGDYPRHQDFDFNLRVFLEARKAVFVDLNLYFWVQWSGSKTHQPETWGLYHQSRTAILYDNWRHLAPENSRYEHYLLDALYRAMVFWEEWSRKSSRYPEVKALCDDYQKKTRNAYVKNKDIRLFRKVFCLTMLSFPGLSHLVMKLTSNAR